MLRKNIMERYLAKLVFAVSVDGTFDHFDEQYRMVEANSAEDAFLKARALARTEAGTFTGAQGQLVQWQQVDVSELFSLDSLQAGDLLFSQSVSQNDRAGYTDFVRRKAMEIQLKNLTFA